jgi:hypothetical protein
MQQTPWPLFSVKEEKKSNFPVRGSLGYAGGNVKNGGVLVKGLLMFE